MHCGTPEGLLFRFVLDLVHRRPGDGAGPSLRDIFPQPRKSGSLQTQALRSFGTARGTGRSPVTTRAVFLRRLKACPSSFFVEVLSGTDSDERGIPWRVLRSG
jgi:hypothetical protein